MKIEKGILMLLGCMAIVIGMDLTCDRVRYKEGALATLESTNDIVGLFPKTPQEIKDRAQTAMKSAEKTIKEIIAVPTEQRTFANTAKALDNAVSASDLAILGRSIHIIDMVSPDEQMRNTARDTVQKIEEFWIDHVSNNVDLFNAFKAYAEGNALKETLTDEQRYFIDETMKDFIRSGLHLPEATRVKIAHLQKELAKLCQDFSAAIAADNRTISVPLEGLAGLEQDFIDALKRNADGTYIISLDYPTYFNVMENVTVEDTRKKLYHAFNNRGYPANDATLKQIIAKRDELAHLLGFQDYAHLNIDNSMVGTPERARGFLDDILTRSEQKVHNEFQEMTAELPESVALTDSGTMNPWNWAFTKASYKKKHFALDERHIAEYFPMEKTLQELFDIYHQFLGINFKEIPIHGLWHPDVKLIEVDDSTTNARLGYLLLDLYPRDNKYSHACEVGIIKATFAQNGTKPAGLALVIANFPKSTATKPSLLKRTDVETFFHEFGHALHELLGRTHIASMAGTNTKLDFVEMPSQMLEEWLWDTAMLKKVSSHYVTGEPLTDELIEKIQKLKHFDSGDWAQRQAYLARLSLALYGPGADKDPYAIMHNLQSLRSHMSNYPEDHMYASFGHLTGYGSQYYSYLWSKVFALDLFEEIKKHGLLNSAIGKKYIADVIGRGGSKDPNELLKDFLGREPNSNAFFADLGI